MIRLKSRQSDLEVLFESELIQESMDLRGFQTTNSISEHNKTYFTRAVIKPTSLEVKYMNQQNYTNLLDLITTDGNLFDVESTEGESYLKVYHNGNITLTKQKDKKTNKFFYTGTLNVEVR